MVPSRGAERVLGDTHYSPNQSDDASGPWSVMVNDHLLTAGHCAPVSETRASAIEVPGSRIVVAENAETGADTNEK